MCGRDRTGQRDSHLKIWREVERGGRGEREVVVKELQDRCQRLRWVSERDMQDSDVNKSAD